MAQLISSSKCFGGIVRKYMHESISTKTNMKFNVFLPASVLEKNSNHKVPSIYFLSGLTCNEDNFITKAGAQRSAALHDIALICPDTSPRGANIPGEDKEYDFGVGAGFYLNAIQDPWKKNYNMYNYIVKELPEIVEEILPVTESKSSKFILIF